MPMASSIEGGSRKVAAIVLGFDRWYRGLSFGVGRDREDVTVNRCPFQVRMLCCLAMF